MILIQPRTVTFSPPEQAVSLMGDFTDWDERPLPINGPLTLEFPEGAYKEQPGEKSDQTALLFLHLRWSLR